jgi:hypothetical protein
MGGQNSPCHGWCLRCKTHRVISRPVEASGHPVSRGAVDLMPGLPLVYTTDPSVMQRRMYVL